MLPLLQPARSTMPVTAAASGSTTVLLRWRRTIASPGRLSATARILASIIHARRRVWCVRLADWLRILFVGSGITTRRRVSCRSC
jgi:hypothetical protein